VPRLPTEFELGSIIAHACDEDVDVIAFIHGLELGREEFGFDDWLMLEISLRSSQANPIHQWN